MVGALVPSQGRVSQGEFQPRREVPRGLQEVSSGRSSLRGRGGGGKIQLGSKASELAQGASQSGHHLAETGTEGPLSESSWGPAQCMVWRVGPTAKSIHVHFKGASIYLSPSVPAAEETGIIRNRPSSAGGPQPTKCRGMEMGGGGIDPETYENDPCCWGAPHLSQGRARLVRSSTVPEISVIIKSSVHGNVTMINCQMGNTENQRRKTPPKQKLLFLRAKWPKS